MPPTGMVENSGLNKKDGVVTTVAESVAPLHGTSVMLGLPPVLDDAETALVVLDDDPVEELTVAALVVVPLTVEPVFAADVA
jgi:hypothetical protein